MRVFIHQKNGSGGLKSKYTGDHSLFIFNRVFMKKVKEFIKAAVLFKQKPLKVVDVQFDKELKKGQILVKLFYSGVCGS